METQGKKIQHIADTIMKNETCHGRDELSKYIFQSAFKQAYRFFTGNKIVYSCNEKCNAENCKCPMHLKDEHN